MPETPVFTPYEFLNAATMNSAAGAVSGSLAQTTSGLSAAGLIRPESVALTASGLLVNASAPLPFQVLFANGVMAGASGTSSVSISSNYSVNFTPLVPVSGTAVTAYLLASYQQIQSGAYQIVGPPPGHPDYNPLFVPQTAYSVAIDSVALTASTTAPDNVSTFELARCSLASGATGVGLLNTAYQQRASALPPTQVLQVSGTFSLSPSTHGGKTLVFTGPSVATLWAASAGNGLEISFSSSTSGVCSVVVSGSDSIYGSSSSAAAIGVSAITVTQGSLVTLESILGLWQTTSESPNANGSAGGGNTSSIWGGTATGTANAQVVSIPASILSFVPGATVSWFVPAGFNNTGAMTLTLSGASTSGVYSVVKDSPSGPLALTGSPSEVAASGIARVQFDGTRLHLYSTVQGTAALANASSNTGVVAAVSGAVTVGALAQYLTASGTVAQGPALTSAQSMAVTTAGGFTVGHLIVAGDVNGTAVDGGAAGVAPAPTYVNGATTLAAGRYLIDTSAGAFAVTVSAELTTGQSIELIDATGSWGGNNLTVNLGSFTITPPGASIAQAGPLVCNVPAESFVLWFNGTTLKVF